LLPRFYALMLVLAPEIDDIAVSYRRGWDASVSYSEALKRGLTADREHGFTRAGPQRADLRFSVGGYSAAETLSRGQQKLLVCALKLAQGAVLSSRHSRRSLYLIDDLPSELDAARCERVCRSIAGMSAQTLITCVDRQSLPAEWLGEKNEIAMFHVEQGEVRPEACS
ncbi:MAG: DNA replication and repair protein RecF, partial [Halieaceae bacterium]